MEGGGRGGAAGRGACHHGFPLEARRVTEHRGGLKHEGWSACVEAGAGERNG